RGIEPPTRGLGNRCSIQLSYGGDAPEPTERRGVASSTLRDHSGCTCQALGISTHSHFFEWEAVTVASASGASAKQPPAMPISAGREDASQKSVVPHFPQKCRTPAFVAELPEA